MKYQGEYTKEISFPLGGIGTGSIGLGGHGHLQDFEIFNRPNKGSINSFTHFAISAVQGRNVTTRILNGDYQKDLTGQYRQSFYCGYGFGIEKQRMVGFPHFRNVVFDGEFPVATLTFADNDFPAEVTMTAFNPFIPGDSKNSSIPAAFFEFEVTNTSDDNIKYRIAFSFCNPYDVGRNIASESNGQRLLTFKNTAVDSTDIAYGDITAATDVDVGFTQSYWYRGSFQDAVTCFWNDINKADDIKDRVYDTDGCKDMGTVGAEIELAPHGSGKVHFVLTWNVPNNYYYNPGGGNWSEERHEELKRRCWKNYYATLFEDSAASAKYCLDNFDELYGKTLRFKNVLHGSTLPKEVIDATSANLSVLKSPTVLRLEDGTFWGWEGVMERAGVCEGTCQHVWNYAYAMCFLFPDLERSIRDMEFKYSTAEDGKMGFRTGLPLGSGVDSFRACVDGHMGTVLKCYREWKLSGDTEWLRSHWDVIKKVLGYAWSEANPDRWDRDKDGVLEGRQHHTLDMELFGPSSWLMSMYMAALKAAAEMAEFFGESDTAAEYMSLYENGCKYIKEKLFNGEYFIHEVDITDKEQLTRYGDEEYWLNRYWNGEAKQIKYQISEGSSIDQMLGQWHADILGLGDIFDHDQMYKALSSMMENNYKSTMRDHANPWRAFSLNDEAGSVICVYPDGANRPLIPVAYCEETMTGFEYSFAGLLCSRGMIEEGLKVVKAVRDRHNGKARNPWNEFECGSNYARSMASYALVPILSGFSFDLPKGYIGFKPYRSGDFKCIFSVDGAWGEFEITGDKAVLSVIGGEIALSSFGIKSDSVKNVKLDGISSEFTCENGCVKFAKTVIKSGIEITL